MTILELLQRDARKLVPRVFLKMTTAGELLGGRENDSEMTPNMRIADRDRQIAEIKAELLRLNSRDHADMSVSDRTRHSELHDRWSLLSTANFDDRQLIARENATAEKLEVRKSRPAAIAEARSNLEMLRKSASSVESGHAKLTEVDRRRLRQAILKVEIELDELMRQ